MSTPRRRIGVNPAGYALEPYQRAILQATAYGDIPRMLSLLYDQLTSRVQHNSLKYTYYEAHHTLQDLGIAIPPSLRGLDTVVGWPGMVVDVLDERLEIDGFTATEAGNLVDWEPIWAENSLYSAASEAHVPALTCGISFLTVGRGAEGEPDPLITIQSPFTTTIAWDYRARRVAVAANFGFSDTKAVDATLYLPDVTIQLERDGALWRETNRDEHGAGRVPVYPLINRPSALRPFGASEISRPIISLTDAAVRTVCGMEVSREFYSSPQRWLLGAREPAFVRPDGKPATGWEAVMGRFLAMSRDEKGELPTIGQFPATSPQPYIGQLQVLSQLIASEAAIPVHYLGFIQDNPASGDAIRRGEGRLLKRTMRRQKSFDGTGWAPAMRHAIALRDGTPITEVPPVKTVWGDPGIPTVGAAADAASKLVAQNIIPAADEVTWRMIGLSDADRNHLQQWAANQAEAARMQAAQAAAQLAAATATAPAYAPLIQPPEQQPPATGAG